MKRPRSIAAETPFAKTLSNSKALSYWRRQKTQMSAVSQVIYIVVLLCNAHACTCGMGHVTERFECKPVIVTVIAQM